MIYKVKNRDIMTTRHQWNSVLRTYCCFRLSRCNGTYCSRCGRSLLSIAVQCCLFSESHPLFLPFTLRSPSMTLSVRTDSCCGLLSSSEYAATSMLMSRKRYFQGQEWKGRKFKNLLEVSKKLPAPSNKAYLMFML